MEEQNPTTPTTKSSENKSPSGVDVDLFLGLSAGGGSAPSLGDRLGEEETAPALSGTPTKESSEKEEGPVETKEKEVSTPSSLKKTKAESSAAGSSPAATEKEASEEVSSSEAKESEEEEAAAEEEDEPPAKRAKTPAQAVKAKEAWVSARESLEGREIIIPKTLDFDLLKQLGVAKEVKEKFAAIGWEKFLDWDAIVYGDLVREFYAELKVMTKGDEGPALIQFKMLGKEWQLSVNEINAMMGMVDVMKMITPAFGQAVKQVPNLTKEEWNGLWAMVGRGEKFDSTTVKGTLLKTPALRMCHRILALNFFGKKDSSNTMSKAELFILWAMETKKELNFGAFVVAHLKNVLTKSGQRLSLTHLPTRFAAQTKQLEEAPVMPVEKEEVLDLNMLSRMFMIKRDSWNKLRIIDVEEKPPAKAGRSVTRSRQTSSATPEPAPEDNTAALARIQATVDEIKAAQLAFFAHADFRYHPPSP